MENIPSCYFLVPWGSGKGDSVSKGRWFNTFVGDCYCLPRDSACMNGVWVVLHWVGGIWRECAIISVTLILPYAVRTEETAEGDWAQNIVLRNSYNDIPKRGMIDLQQPQLSSFVWGIAQYIGIFLSMFIDQFYMSFSMMPQFKFNSVFHVLTKTVMRSAAEWFWWNSNWISVSKLFDMPGHVVTYCGTVQCCCR